MESERSPFLRRNVPRYTFLGSDHHLPKVKARGLQFCLCAAFIALLITGLAILISYYLNRDHSEQTIDRTSRALDDLLNMTWPLKGENYSKQFLPNVTIQKRALEVGIKNLKQKETIEDHLPLVPIDSPTFRHQLATHTSKHAQEMSKLGYILNGGTREIEKCLANYTRIGGRKPRKWFMSNKRKLFPSEMCLSNNDTLDCPPSQYRTADGTCNNIRIDKTWGAAMRSFRRILLPAYADGVSEPRKAVDGSDLPSARDVSLAVHRPIYKNDVNFTVMLAVWGQFIDHDMTASAISRGKGGAAISCCHDNQNNMLEQHPECFPVHLGNSDPFHIKFNVSCMNFVRSSPAPTCAFGPREQLNQVTSFLDGSTVYGSDEDVMNQLRTFEGGRLKMLKTSSGDLLPISVDLNDGCNREEESKRGRYCFLSGTNQNQCASQSFNTIDRSPHNSLVPILTKHHSIYKKDKLSFGTCSKLYLVPQKQSDPRSNENLLLASMHLLFARQHNAIAEELSKINPKWTDEKLFQESRKILGAQIQHITYNEFLPSILPDEMLSRLGMKTKDSYYSIDYDSTVDPSIANSFAAAAFRFGHTLLPGLIRFLRDNATHEEYLELHKMLFNPFELYETQFLENFMRGAMNTSTEKSDAYFNHEITQKLFKKQKKGPCGLDLVSLNIQRGRDHGLPSYPNWREICGLSRPESFDDLKGNINEDSLEKIRSLYKSVDDLDLYTGALAEEPIPGGLVGPTITCLLADQFLRIKIGDRYWYETEQEPQRFTLDQLDEIRKTSLAKIICKTSGVEECPPHVMRRTGIGNEMKQCRDFPYPNLKVWKEEL